MTEKQYTPVDIEAHDVPGWTRCYIALALFAPAHGVEWDRDDNETVKLRLGIKSQTVLSNRFLDQARRYGIHFAGPGTSMHTPMQQLLMIMGDNQPTQEMLEQFVGPLWGKK